MGAKSAMKARLKQWQEEAEKEGKKPSLREVAVPKEMRPTAESIEEMGERIDQARKRNPNYNPLWVEYRPYRDDSR